MQYNANKDMGITREKAFEILKSFANEIRKTNRHHPPMEIIVVGGGSILLNYQFRESTHDFDVLVRSDSDIKETVYKVAEQYNLPDNWMNTDFKKTNSFSNKLRDVSEHRASYNNGRLEIRTVKDEYLIAMKMVSAREYRNDISDIAGIIQASKAENNDIPFDIIKNAVEYLYGSSPQIKDHIWQAVEDFTKMDAIKLAEVYCSIRSEEKALSVKLTDIDHKYPGMIKEENLQEVINGIKKGLSKTNIDNTENETERRKRTIR